MINYKLKPLRAALLLALFGVSGIAGAIATIQCPGDNELDPNAVIDTLARGNFPLGPVGDAAHEQALAESATKCQHLSSSEGYISMADGRPLFMFGFGDITGTLQSQAQGEGILNAHFPAAPIVVEQNQEFFLTLTNSGFTVRPDLSDGHTVHYHGFPNASAAFDGVPENSFAVNPNASLTYFYKQAEPGTYMYHCHNEATEHMQMGMLGNLYVHSAQDRTGIGGTVLLPNTATQSPRFGGTGPLGYVYNDGDGATAFDVELGLQMGSWDADFHDASEATQPLPFANMKDNYAMLNGRGYPDTTNTNALPAPVNDLGEILNVTATIHDNGVQSQQDHSKVTANPGDKILLRISNLNVTNFYTLLSLGLDMKVVGSGAKIMRSNGDTAGTDISYSTNSITIGGGESKDVIIDTTGALSGTYYVYTSNLNYLSNNQEDFGGMMTEITIN